MKRKRLPKGFGQISFIKEKDLIRPYRAMVTTGRDKTTGKYNRKIIGYYSSYETAYEALQRYNYNPTLSIAFDKWFKYKGNSLSYPQASLSAFKALARYHSTPIGSIKESDIDSLNITPTVKANAIALVHTIKEYYTKKKEG